MIINLNKKYLEKLTLKHIKEKNINKFISFYYL